MNALVSGRDQAEKGDAGGIYERLWGAQRAGAGIAGARSEQKGNRASFQEVMK